MISLSQVTKNFGSVQAVRGVTLEVPKGQVVGILGPNGAGKTTTIRMITGSIPPSSGFVRVDGLDSVDDSMGVRRRLGYLPESAPLYPEMRVRDFLQYRARLYGVPARGRRSAIEQSLNRCQISDVAGRRIGTLSKGYRQRVGLAASLVHDPLVLILDEPTTGLDPAQIAETRRLVRDLAGERTTLVVSHILPEVEKSCDRIVLFARGRIQADGPPDQLISELPGAGRYTVEARQEVRQGVSPESALRSIPGVESVDSAPTADGWTRCLVGWSEREGDRREQIARACVRAGLIVRELRPQAASLEDVYLRVIAYADDAPPPPPPQPPTSAPARGSAA